jgi:hypothetical protein
MSLNFPVEKQFYGNEGKLTGSLVKKVLQFPSHTRQLRQFLLEFTSEKNGIQEHSYVLQLVSIHFMFFI